MTTQNLRFRQLQPQKPSEQTAEVSELPIQAGSAKGGRDLSIDYLRTTLTMMVIAHHSVLAYTTWAAFNTADVFRSTAPVVDGSRWIVFDYAENFNDVFFMTLMFFISGLFVYPAIRKHGPGTFARDRLLRLGAPFVVAVCGVMPLALYPSWTLGNHSSSFSSFYAFLAHARYQVGPPWFIWVLLLFDLVVSILVVLPGLQWLLINTQGFVRRLQSHSGLVFVAMVVLSSIAYLPLLARFGFSQWTVLFTSPFAFQQARIALYALWFAAGFAIGAPGTATGLLSRSGSLALHWQNWALACLLAFATLSFIPPLLRHAAVSSVAVGAVEALLWVVSCVTSCFAFLAIFRGLEIRPSRLMNTLSRSAYIMYLVHYVFITWTQKLLLAIPLHASLKATIVFITTVTLSWLVAQVLIRIPGVRTIV